MSDIVPTPTPSRLGVVGAGYVGLTTGACLAHLGHEVVCADVDADRVEQLRRGQIPIVEEGLSEIVVAELASGRLSFELGAEAAATDTDVVFLCVPTPQGADGGADLRYIEAAATQIAPVLKPGALVVNKSTVPVGSTKVVEDVLQRNDVAVVSNPEFLREGTAVHDFLHPDRVVIGSDDRAAGERLADVYAPLQAPILITDPASAETIKYAANGFLAMKISFVNAISAMCEAVGASVDDVVEGIGSDARIGRSFLRPGPGWGGSCFPKDSKALVKIAADYGYDFTMMKGVIDVNEEQKRRMVAKVREAVGVGPGLRLTGTKVGVLGLTFKAGTDDLRDSPSVTMVQSLVAAGATVRAFDPTVEVAPTGPKAQLLAGVELCADPLSAATGAAVLVIATEWPEFAKLDLDALAGVLVPGSAVVDTRNLLDPAAVRAAGLRYDGVGRR
ncbi:UDP-glucose dehydrogenase family protein [Desertimonas flava]|uniref:UDP-glucose dehydrogenase family protein n=1 Tax=Desertimonas flava TaxID=2064846 RepID=UPI000E34374B|nr:UDP-glucose/GDP-mannose dehydrogenase family protein [Desertimonas flava]